jgi:branched-chain amino acid transport system substrate-binding protein
VRSAATLALVALAAIVGGCGSASRPGERIRGRTLVVYFSGPQHGASSLGAVAALNGAKLALSDAAGHVGKYRVVLKVLDDSTQQSVGWDPSQTTLNARTAAQDPAAIGYLGEFNSGASAIAIPLLNRQGIVEISPGSTAVGLTTARSGASPGEPEKYYPTGKRTFARVLPTDAGQALALVRVEQAASCHDTFVLQDGEVDGEDTALTFLLTAQSAGLRVVGVQAYHPQAIDYSALATSVARSGANCVLISSIDEPSAVRLTEQVAHDLPRATIFASNGLADSAYANPASGGLPSALDPRVIVVSATLGLAAYPRSARVLLARYARRFGASEPPALYGYTAMQLLLDAVRQATDGGHKTADRGKVVSELFSERRRTSPMGSFRVDRAGDTSLQRFGIYRIARGRLVFVRSVG